MRLLSVTPILSGYARGDQLLFWDYEFALQDYQL